MEFFRQEYWSGLPVPSPGDLPYPRTEPRSPTLQADALPSEPPGKPRVLGRFIKSVNSCTSILGGFLLNSLLRFSFLPSPLPSPFSLYHWDSSLPCFLLFLLELLLFMYQSSWISLLIFFSFLFFILFSQPCLLFFYWPFFSFLIWCFSFSGALIFVLCSFS